MIVRVIKTCITHGETIFKETGQGVHQRIRCAKCNVERVTKRRRKVKQMLVDHFGGKCVRCGYDKCIRALVFHHLDPTKKDFSISVEGVTRSFEKTLIEANKCALLCQNCHSEVHEELYLVEINNPR